MGSRVEIVEVLENAGGAIHILLALIHALGWSLGELEDVRNDEGGPARLERAYSLLERWPDEVGRAERHQALENILYDNGAETDDDDDDEDEDDADDEQEGDNFQEALAPALVAGRSPQVEEEAAAVEEGVGLEPAAVEAGVGLEPALQVSQGSQDSVLNYEEDSGDETEPPQYDDNDLLDCDEETDAFAEEEGDEWAGEGEEGEDEVEETDKEESGEQSATDGETQATQGADGSDQEGAGPSGSWARSARLGSEACGGAVGRKRGADAAYCTPLQPKRPRHESSTSSTVSNASIVDTEAAVAEGASMVVVEPPPDDFDSAGGNALVVYNGAAAAMAAMPMVPIDDGGSTAEATAEGRTLIELKRQVSDLQQGQRQMMLNMAQIHQVVQRLWYPEELVAECNKAVAAIGVANVRQGTGFFLAQGLIVTVHHVLLDCGWNAAAPSLLKVGLGEVIDWSHQAEVLAWAPTPRAPAPGMPDHRFKKPKPWIDLALLKIVPSPSSPIAGLGACLRAARLPAALGMQVAILGYGQQASSNAQTVTFGVVSCCARRDDRIGCTVFDIDANMLSGHSGGPVIDRRDGGVMGYCISSQSEGCAGKFEGTMDTPTGPKTIRGKAKVQVTVGGLHTAIPISELGFLLGTSLTA